MSKSKKVNGLAYFGGKPVRKKVFASRPFIGTEEKKAIGDCLSQSAFSRFIGSPTPKVRSELRMSSQQALSNKEFWSFLGGRNVRKFEALWAKAHDVPFAISVNSATSGLTAALLAAGLKPGDHVITTPFSFTATATSIVLAGCVPVFVDVDLDTFCLDPNLVKQNISSQTKAIMPVHLLGNPGDLASIMEIAKKNNLIIIEDSAQAPGLGYQGKMLGSLGHAGVFSFQETKNVMTGEGGMIVTKSPEIAEKCRLIRNHGESIPNEDDPASFINNIVGFNFRMTELTAALGWAQTQKLRMLNGIRRKNGLYLRKRLAQVAEEFITPQKLTNPESYAPYCLGFRWDPEKSGVSRNLIAEALRAEGIPVATGYPRLMSDNVLFTKSMGLPNAHLPNAARLQNEEYLGFFQVGWPNTEKDMEDIVQGFKKILANMDRLRSENQKFKQTHVDFISGRR